MASSFNTCNVVSVRLDEHNYHIWFFQMQHHLRSLGLLKFVDGTHLCPSPPLTTPDGISNECLSAREKWFEQDSFIISMISNTVSPDALTHIIGCQSSMEVWLSLMQRYATISVSHIMQLKFSLYHLKKESDSVDKYLLRFKTIRDKLALVGVHISDEEIKFLILAGLPCEYGHTRQIIRGTDDVDLQKLRSLLLSAECEIEFKKSASFIQFSAMMDQNDMFHNHNYGMNYGMILSSSFGQPVGLHSNLLSSLDNLGVTQNSMANMHYYNASPARDCHSIPRNSLRTGTGFSMPHIPITSPTTFQQNFNLSNMSYQSVLIVGDNSFMVNNNMGSEGKYGSLFSPFGFTHQYTCFPPQNGSKVSYGNQQQQVHVMNSCSAPQQDVMVPRQQFSQQNAQSVAFKNRNQHNDITSPFSVGGYSDDSVSCPNFPDKKATLNNSCKRTERVEKFQFLANKEFPLSKCKEMDTKRAEIEKELKDVREQKEEVKINQIEAERLKNKRAATQDCMQKERDGLGMPFSFAISNQTAFVCPISYGTQLHCPQVSHGIKLCQARPLIPPD